jgi:immunoglobulin-binding protein 1
MLEHDEVSLRDLHLTHIALCTHESFQALESLVMETQILSDAPTSLPQNPDSQEDLRRRQGARNDYSERLDRPLAELLTSKTGPILDKSGRPLRPFTLLDSRQRLQQGVFRPDHNLPTMSIDEYLEEEKRRGGIIEGGGEKSGIRPQVDEDNYEKLDEETMKARTWDDFKDDNPRGSGNTLNRG